MATKVGEWERWVSAVVDEPEGIEAVREYYRESAGDYLCWSAAGNMHFGLWRRGISMWDREAMLHGMTEKVADWLDLDDGSGLDLLDLGCGIGAPARWIGSRYPEHRVRGLTIVEEQAAEGNRRNEASGLGNVVCEVRNYLATGLEGGSVDRAYALESACYAPGSGKRALLREAARLVKPGGQLVVADPMLRADASTSGLFGRALKRWCRDFAVPEMARIDDFGLEMLEAGFVDIEVEEVSLSVFPCLLHAPPLVLLHAVRERLRGPLSEWRKRHLTACLLSFYLGLHLDRIGYFVIRATRGEAR